MEPSFARQPETDVAVGQCESSIHFEYETQHFGFTPITLINGMYNTVCDFYRDALKAFCKTCSEKYSQVMTVEELTEARHGVEKKVDQDICTVFDCLEFYLLQNVFSIPKNIVLPEDKCQMKKEGKTEHTEMENKKKELEKRIIAVKDANSYLSQHLDETASLQTTLDAIIQKMSTMEGKVSGMGAGELKDYLSYCNQTILNEAKKN